MSDSVQEILDVPREFVKDGIQFLNRCQKRKCSSAQWATLAISYKNALADVLFPLVHSRQEGVQADLPGCWCWFPDHGRCWIHC